MRGVPGSGAISDFVFARVGFIDDLSFQQDGIFGRESRCGMYRMLDPALYGFVHIDQVSKKVTSPYIRIPKMSVLYHISPRRSSYFLRPRHQNIQICKTDGVKPQLLAATLK